MSHPVSAWRESFDAAAPMQPSPRIQFKEPLLQSGVRPGGGDVLSGERHANSALDSVLCIIQYYSVVLGITGQRQARRCIVWHLPDSPRKARHHTKCSILHTPYPCRHVHSMPYLLTFLQRKRSWLSVPCVRAQTRSANTAGFLSSSVWFCWKNQFYLASAFSNAILPFLSSVAESITGGMAPHNGCQGRLKRREWRLACQLLPPCSFPHRAPSPVNQSMPLSHCLGESFLFCRAHRACLLKRRGSILPSQATPGQARPQQPALLHIRTACPIITKGALSPAVPSSPPHNKSGLGVCFGSAGLSGLQPNLPVSTECNFLFFLPFF